MLDIVYSERMKKIMGWTPKGSLLVLKSRGSRMAPCGTPLFFFLDLHPPHHLIIYFNDYITLDCWMLASFISTLTTRDNWWLFWLICLRTVLEEGRLGQFGPLFQKILHLILRVIKYCYECCKSFCLNDKAVIKIPRTLRHLQVQPPLLQWCQSVFMARSHKQQLQSLLEINKTRKK